MRKELVGGGRGGRGLAAAAARVVIIAVGGAAAGGGRAAEVAVERAAADVHGIMQQPQELPDGQREHAKVVRLEVPAPQAHAAHGDASNVHAPALTIQLQFRGMCLFENSYQISTLAVLLMISNAVTE